ncbi:MAG: PAC2 family protein [Dehalococcoidales bacterium]|nr:PAC2 family protein [Dehalococcoidales bacterium]
MKKLVKLIAKPKLNSPVMLAAWPGVGNVSIVIANYLLNKLDFKDLAEIDAGYFFDPIGVLAREYIVEAPQFPQSRFYYWKNKKGQNDLILFIGDDQPDSKIYDFAGCVLDLADAFGVERVYTCAAAMTNIHFTEQPKVWAVGTNKHLVEELKKHELLQKGNIQIAGLNGLLLGLAKERDFDGVCLMAEVPAQTSRMENPIAALTILRVFARLLSIEIDYSELEGNAKETLEQIKQATAIAMGEYIEHFTQPIWEQGNGEEEEGEDEGNIGEQN